MDGLQIGNRSLFQGHWDMLFYRTELVMPVSRRKLLQINSLLIFLEFISVIFASLIFCKLNKYIHTKVNPIKSSGAIHDMELLFKSLYYYLNVIAVRGAMVEVNITRTRRINND